MIRHGAAMAMGACALLAACERPAPTPAAADSNQPPVQSAYVQPPEITSAARGPGGAVVLSGTGLPQALVRLASPKGFAVGGEADAAGAWTVTVPAAPEPRLWSLSEDADGRLLRARGYIAMLPPPGPAATILRPTTGAEPVARIDARLAIAAVDFDRSGVAVVSGSAEPGQQVKASLDGASAGEGRANARGVYVVSLAQPLSPGEHDLSVANQQTQVSVHFESSVAATVATPPFRATRGDGSWRIDWIAPGGGAQSTIIFDPPGGVL